VAAEQIEDAISEEIGATWVWGGAVFIDDVEMGRGLLGQDESEGLGRRSRTMLDGEGEVVVAPAQVEVGIAPGVQAPRDVGTKRANPA